MSSDSLSRDIKQKAHQLGFDLVGICPAVTASGFSELARWLADGHAGEMNYLADRLPAYEHPRHVLEGVKSLVVLGVHYRSATPVLPANGQGRVSRYAWGADYHDVLRERLHHLADSIKRRDPNARMRGVVDSAPLLEREFARLAGLGWVGKHTLLLNRQSGSYFFLATLLTDLELEYDAPFDTDHCGTCTACLDACPTQAFPRPYVLDATRCISYLTIEHRSNIPREQRSGMGDWLFGCDICQDVCPWNQRSPQGGSKEFWPRSGLNPVELYPLFELTEAQFRQTFRDTPLWRAKRRGILRNAAIVLGNSPRRVHITVLARGLGNDEPLVRGASAWSLGRHSEWPEARSTLLRAMALEKEDPVLQEIHAALRDR